MIFFTQLIFSIAGVSAGPALESVEPGLPLPESAIVQDGEVEIDQGSIRFGNAADFDPDKKHKVGVLLSTRVYEAIPAYQTVKRERIPPDSARYAQLMKEATRAYRGALAKVARDGGYVLLVESGGIRGYPVSDVTDAVISVL